MLRQIKLREEGKSLSGSKKGILDDVYNTPENTSLSTFNFSSPPSTPIPPRLPPRSSFSEEIDFVDDLQMPTTTKKKRMTQFGEEQSLSNLDFNEFPINGGGATFSSNESTPNKFNDLNGSMSPDSVLESLSRSPLPSRLRFSNFPTSETPSTSERDKRTAPGPLDDPTKILDEDVSSDFFDGPSFSSSSSYNLSGLNQLSKTLWTPNRSRNANINPFSPEKFHSPRSFTKMIGQNIFSEESHFRETFEQLEEIGSSKKNIAYLCRHMVDGWLYTVKKSKGKTNNNVTQQKKHLLEVYALAALAGHNNIVRYYTAWIEDQRLFIQMEYFKEGSLIDQKKKRSSV